MSDYVLGVDGGGTKTLAVVASKEGKVLGVSKKGGSNFQSCGVNEAMTQLGVAAISAMDNAGISPSEVSGVCYGVSGADREVDFSTIRTMLGRVNFWDDFSLVNDTIIALRAGTADGVGIALIAGTGSNAIGRNSRGETLQVGGMGALTGDYGSAGQLAEAAIVAAFKGLDGRGEETILASMFCEHLGLSALEDIIEYEFFDQPRGKLDMGSLAPLVFEAANRSDIVAQQVLQKAGEEIGTSAMVIMNSLFDESQEVTVVFGGSVFTKGASPVLRDTVKQYIRSRHERVNFVKLEDEPVLGAVAFAMEEQGWTCSENTMHELSSSLKYLLDVNP